MNKYMSSLGLDYHVTSGKYKLYTSYTMTHAGVSPRFLQYVEVNTVRRHVLGGTGYSQRLHTKMGYPLSNRPMGRRTPHMHMGPNSDHRISDRGRYGILLL